MNYIRRSNFKTVKKDEKREDDTIVSIETTISTVQFIKRFLLVLLRIIICIFIFSSFPFNWISFHVRVQNVTEILRNIVFIGNESVTMKKIIFLFTVDILYILCHPRISHHCFNKNAVNIRNDEVERLIVNVYICIEIWNIMQSYILSFFISKWIKFFHGYLRCKLAYRHMHLMFDCRGKTMSYDGIWNSCLYVVSVPSIHHSYLNY